MFRLAQALILAMLTACLCATGATAASRETLFDYDRTAPLEVVFKTASAWKGVVRQGLSFKAGESLRLQAFFVHPPTGGPWPLVVWSPGAGGDRRQQLPEALDLARKGVASLLIDSPPLSHGCNGDRDLSFNISYVVSRRRAVDLAETLPKVDPRRLAAAGWSLGAEITAELAGVEHRIRAFTLKAGRGHVTGYGRTFCTSLSAPELAAWAEQVGVIDPVRWIGKASRAAILLQNGTKDALAPRGDVLALYAAARKPKQLVWYPAGHDLDASATAFRATWLLRQLGV